jgi:signal transduction histidine kinase
MAAVVLCVVAAGLVFYLIRNPLVDRQAYLNLERIAGAIMRRSETLNDLQNNPGEIVQRIDRLVDVRVLVLYPDRSVLVDSRRDTSEGFGPLALISMRLPSGLVRDRTGGAWLYAMRELPDGDTLVLAIPRPRRVSLLLAQRFRDLLREDIFPPFLAAGGFALLLTLVLAYWIARWVATPLQRMALAARHVADGNYRPIDPQGPEEVRRLANTLNEMAARVQDSQQSQRDFVANVSHELKTPLTSIQGFAQAIMDGTAHTAEDLHQAASVIFTEATRMHHLVLDLLDLARFDAGTISMERVPIDLPEMLQGIAARFEPQARQIQADLELQIDELPILIGDADRLAQVFSNLLDNAFKFTPSEGKVTLMARRVGELAEVSVSDTGPGIPPKEIERIFERFYQTDRSRRGGRDKGVGLGLAIAREIVLAHGGIITAQNNIPQGSLFVVKIPFARPNVSTLAAGGINHAARNDHRPMLQ